MDPFAPETPHPKLPLAIITGFLGSGKTTLLARLIAQPDMAASLVIINELGTVGLDHLLVERIEGEVTLLHSGCLCCTLRGDLEMTLQRVIGQRQRGEIPGFDRVLIETTGLADPAPIMQLATMSPMIRRYFRLAAVIATVDAVNGLRQLEENPESVKQVALADRILLTKTDLADPVALSARIAAINPAAPLCQVRHGEIAAASLFTAGPAEPLVLPAGAIEPGEHLHGPRGFDHDHRIRTHGFEFDTPLDWPTIAEWLTALTAEYGDRLLRIKGVLDLAGEPRPIAIHAVHHTFHAPAALAGWPTAERRSLIVFITRDMERATIEDSLRSFVAAD